MSGARVAAGASAVDGSRALLHLQDLDLLIGEVGSAESRARLSKLGLGVGEPATLQRQRHRLFAAVDPRWQRHYERASMRYGRGVVVVQERVCQGCRVKLPTSAAPGPGESLTLCESCGRVLFWG
jgi:predicted  nucleic acid-binding Zn-ribbon protein